MLALLFSLARKGTSISPEADPKIYDLDPQNQISRKAKTLVPAAGNVGSALSPVEVAEDKAAAYGDRARRQWGEVTLSPLTGSEPPVESPFITRFPRLPREQSGVSGCLPTRRSIHHHTLIWEP